jgi:WD40 repeat protein
LERKLNEGEYATAKFSADGRWLVTSTRQEHRFWETGSWQPRHAIRRPAGSHTGGSMAFSADPSTMALSPGLRGVQLVETATGRELATLDAENQLPLCFSPDGSRLVTGDTTGTVRLWDLPLVRQQLAALKLDWGPAR